MGWMWLAGPFGLAFLGLVVMLLWSGMQMSAPRGGRGDGDDPEHILKQRYARGEIDRDEYQRMLSDLRR